MLLALLSTSRISGVTHLGMYYFTNHSSEITPFLPTWRTCQRSKKPQPNLKFYNFQGDSNLCVCKAIASYLQKRLRSWGLVWGVEESQFVSHIKQHKPVSASAVSMGLGQVLTMAGIYTEVFKEHSTRSASSSKAEVTGLNNRHN